MFKQILNDDGNATTLEYNGNTILENIYNSLGNIIQSTDMSNDENNIHKYYYDKFGNLYRETNTQHNTNVEFENTLNPDTNQLDESTIRLGNDTYRYNYSYTNKLNSTISNLSLTKFTNSDSPTAQTTPIFESNISYDRLGRISEIVQGINRKQYHYLSSGDHTSNLISSVWYGDNLKLNENYKYRYDEKGNILEIRENGTLIARYKYDCLSRLIREDNKSFNKTTTYEYDAGGNIICKNIYNFTLVENLDFETIQSTIPYLYKSTGWRDQLVSYNGESFVYDSIGNPTTYRNKTLSWSHARQLDSFGDIASFKYNANGIRISKTVNGITTKYYLNGNKIISQTDATNTLFFYYGTDGVTGFNHNGTDYFYKKNIQGDIIGIYDNTNTLICKYIYDAWGNHKIYILNENNGTSYELIDNSVNTLYNNIAKLNPFRYRSYYFDTETDLYYLNSRYYDSQTGRFINVDDLNNLDSDSINGLNLYTYCANNPNNYVDPDGNKAKWWQWLLFGIGAALVIAAVVVLSVSSGGAFTGLAGSIIVGAAKGALIGATVGTAVGIAGGAIYSSMTGADMGQSILSGFLMGFGIGAIAGALIGGTVGGLSYTNAANAWNGGKKSMIDHFIKHGKPEMGYKNPIKYTKDALNIVKNGTYYSQKNAYITAFNLAKKAVNYVGLTQGGQYLTTFSIRTLSKSILTLLGLL